MNKTGTVFTFMKLWLHWQAAAKVFEVLQVKQNFDFSRLGTTYPVVPPSLGREELDLTERERERWVNFFLLKNHDQEVLRVLLYHFQQGLTP